MEKLKRFFMKKQDIALFKGILDGYEDVALLTVIDGEKGIIQLSYASCYENILMGIIEDLKKYNIYLEEA